MTLAFPETLSLYQVPQAGYSHLDTMNFSDYLLQVAETLETSNGHNLAYLLRPTSPHGKELVKQFRKPTVQAF